MMKCKDCEYCHNIGRCNSQRNRPGRKQYECRHPKISEIPREDFGNAMMGFIGFGRADSYDSTLTVKTSPRWCPKKKFGE